MYERMLQTMYGRKSNDDLFDLKERCNLVKQEGAKLAREKQEQLLEKMRKAEALLQQKQIEREMEQAVKKEQQSLKEK